VAGEGHDIIAQFELLVNGPHGRLFGVHVLHGFGVVLVEVGDELEEVFEAPLLEYPHQTLEEAESFSSERLSE